MIPAADDLAQDIFTQLNAVPRGHLPSEFEVKRIERVIEKLRPNDPATAYQLAGALASVRGAIEEMHRAHKRALQLEHDTDAYTNYACSLQRTGFFAEGAKMLEHASACEPTNLEILARWIKHEYLAGHFTRAATLLEDVWSTRAPDRQHEDAIEIAQAAEVERQHGITDNDLERFVRLVASVAHEAGEFAVDSSIGISTDDVSGWVSLTLYPRSRPHLVERLNDQLLEALLASDLPPAVNSAVVTRFTAAVPDADNAERVA